MNSTHPQPSSHLNRRRLALLAAGLLASAAGLMALHAAVPQAASLLFILLLAACLTYALWSVQGPAGQALAAHIRPPARGLPRLHSQRPPARPTPRRWAAFGLATAASAAGLMALHAAMPEAAGMIFTLLLAIAAGAALWRSFRRGWAALQALTLPAFIVWALLPFRLLLALLQAGAGLLAARRRPVAGTLTMAALLLMALSALSLQVSRVGGLPLNEALILMAAGAAALWAALALLRGGAALPAAITAAPLPRGRARWLSLGLGALALAGLGEISGNALRLPAFEQPSPHAQMALLAAGCVLVARGLTLRPLPGSLKPAAASGADPIPARYGWQLLAAILVLAFTVRFIGLGTFVRYSVDEMNTIPEVLAFTWQPGGVRLLTEMTGISPFPWVFAYFQWAGTWVLGSTLQGIRLASAVAGTLTVLAVYWLARAVFDRPTALLAALLLAAFPPHIHFSRLALLNIADPLVGTLGLAFLAQGMVRGRWRDYALAGVFLGLTFYFYNGGRMFYTPLAAVWVGLGLLVWRPRPPLRGLLVTLAALLITAAPMIYTMRVYGYYLVGRMEASGLGASYWLDLIARGDLGAYLHRLSWALRFTVQNPDDTIYYGGDTPLVLPVLVPLLLLGAAWALYHWRRPGGLLLCLWLVGAAVGNSVLIISAASTRFVIAFPALALLLAAGLRYMLPLVWPPLAPALALHLRAAGRWRRFRWPPRCPERHRRRVLAAVAAGCAALQIAYYFGPHLAFYNRQLRIVHRFPDGYDAVYRSLAFPSGTHIHIISAEPFSQMDAQGLFDFLRGHNEVRIHTLTPTQFDSAYLDQMACGVDHAFFIQLDDRYSAEVIRDHFYVRNAERSPDAEIIPDERELILLYAPHVPGIEALYGLSCDDER